MLSNRLDSNRVDRADHDSVYSDRDLHHIQSVAMINSSTRRLGIEADSSAQLISLESDQLAFEKILSLIASAVFIPVISTSVNCSLSVVTCNNLFAEALNDPDLPLAPPPLFSATGLNASSGLDIRILGFGSLLESACVCTGGD